jgi:hypothetical protein
LKDHADHIYCITADWDAEMNQSKGDLWTGSRSLCYWRVPKGSSRENVTVIVGDDDKYVGEVATNEKGELHKHGRVSNIFFLFFLS